jgi:hypothetical protein
MTYGAFAWYSLWALSSLGVSFVAWIWTTRDIATKIGRAANGSSPLAGYGVDTADLLAIYGWYQFKSHGHRLGWLYTDERGADAVNAAMTIASVQACQLGGVCTVVNSPYGNLIT